MDELAASLSTWVRRLRAVGERGLPGGFLELQRRGAEGSPEAARAWIAGFRDGEGNRRAVDGFFLGHMLRVAPAVTSRTPTPEARVWALLTEASPDIASTPVDWTGSGRLFPALADEGIETWTEAELSSVQALAWLGLRERSQRVMERVTSAAEWLVREVQPDNATQHPWGAGFFIARSMDASMPARSRQEYALYAQTLVENALVGREHPDVFSACILWDSAAWMDALAASGWNFAE
jgi:hypothetical protein